MKESLHLYITFLLFIAVAALAAWAGRAFRHDSSQTHDMTEYHRCFLLLPFRFSLDYYSCGWRTQEDEVLVISDSQKLYY